MESSEGNRTVHHWPAFHGLVSVALVLGRCTPDERRARLGDRSDSRHRCRSNSGRLANAVSILIFLPIVMLSQLDINSPAGVLSGRILGKPGAMPVLVDVLLF